MMEKKTIQTVSPLVREAYAKAGKVGPHDPNLCIQLFKGVVKMDPCFIKARERLRDLEQKKTMAMGMMSRMMAQFGSLFSVIGIRAALRRDAKEALDKCEDALANCLDLPAVLRVLADAALEFDAPFIAVEAAKLLNDFHPGKDDNIYLLVRCMQKNNQAREAVKVFQEIARRHPGNIKIQSELRAAMALASMEHGRWEEEGTTQERAVGLKETIAEQIGEGTIHDTDQAQLLIAKYLKDLEEKDSIDVRRKLAEAYMAAKRYDEAITELEKVAAGIGSLDPLVDKAIEAAVLAKFDLALAELRTNPAAYDRAEEQIAQFEAQRADYRQERAEARARTYPNDAQLRHDLALVKYERGDYDAAIEQFQHSRRSPKLSLEAGGYLGRCFAAKKQYDMAIEQLESVLERMDRMDKEKLEMLYFIACLYEETGKTEKALEYFKIIYQAQANFRDVATRIAGSYEKAKTDA